MTVIKIKPHRWGWKAFESPGVEPVFPKKDQAIDYARNRACFRLKSAVLKQRSSKGIWMPIMSGRFAMPFKYQKQTDDASCDRL